MSTHTLTTQSVAEALEAAGLEKPTLIGTSLGANTALRLALAHPDRIEALVLESPSYQLH